MACLLPIKIGNVGLNLLLGITNAIMTVMKGFLLTLFVLMLSILACQSQSGKSLVPYSWKYGHMIHGTILVPPGFKEETRDYREGIVTYLRYVD